MKKTLTLALALATAVAVVSLPALAQGRPQAGVTPPPTTGVQFSNPARSFPQRVFVPGFGLQPVIPEQFPVFGQGFDAHHFHILHGQPFFFPGGFIGGGFFGSNFFGGGFFPLPLVSSSSTVVVVPQVVPVQVPVVVQEARPAEVVVTTGLPPDWGEVHVAKPSYPVERPPLAHLTLLVLKNQTIFAVTDYWLEDGRIFYVTSTGKQDSIAVRDLDWEMTTQLNAERGVEFVLRSEH